MFAAITLSIPNWSEITHALNSMSWWDFFCWYAPVHIVYFIITQVRSVRQSIKYNEDVREKPEYDGWRRNHKWQDYEVTVGDQFWAGLWRLLWGPIMLIMKIPALLLCLAFVQKIPKSLCHWTLPPESLSEITDSRTDAFWSNTRL